MPASWEWARCESSSRERIVLLANRAGPWASWPGRIRAFSMNSCGTRRARARTMPSFAHEVLVELLRDGELVRALLAVGGVTAEGAPHLADATLAIPEIRADVVLLFGGEHRLAVVVEVQRSRDVQKLLPTSFTRSSSAGRRYRRSPTSTRHAGFPLWQC